MTKKQTDRQTDRPDMSMLWMRTDFRILAADIGGWNALQMRTFAPVLSSKFSVLHFPSLVRFKYLLFCRLLNDSQWLFRTWTHHIINIWYHIIHYVIISHIITSCATYVLKFQSKYIFILHQSGTGRPVHPRPALHSWNRSPSSSSSFYCRHLRCRHWYHSDCCWCNSTGYRHRLPDVESSRNGRKATRSMINDRWFCTISGALHNVGKSQILYTSPLTDTRWLLLLLKLS